MKALRSLFLGAASLCGMAVCLPTAEMASSPSSIQPSFDVSSCSGYKAAGRPRQHKHGFTMPLTLKGPACNAYGVDIHNLTLAVVYEKKHQLHVHIYDTDKNQYQLPLDLIMNRPSSNPQSDELEGEAVTAEDSDLHFHHTAEEGYDDSDSPSWAFWITRANADTNADPIFDTRAERIPTYLEPFNTSAVNTERNTTAMPNHNMVFENQYVQISSVLPTNANVYGLGERYSTGGIGASSWRLDPDGMLQPMNTLDAGDPLLSNMYGYHPVYLEARQERDKTLRSHVVAYQSTAGMDVIMRRGLIQYRAIGGTLDLRFMSGDEQAQGEDSVSTNNPQTAMEQYVQYANLPIMVPRWSFGFHMLRWGYKNTSMVRDMHQTMLDQLIPLEAIWSDIDHMNNFRDFTFDPATYSDYPDFVNNLTALGQHWIPIVDAAIPATPLNDSDVYYPGERGSELDVFVKNTNGTDYIGIVWPGPAKFLDNHADNAQEWLSAAYRNFSQLANFSGIWLDMNEPSSFIIGSAVDPAHLNASNTAHVASTSVGGWPEGYCNQTWGSSGNITVRGQKTFSSDCLDDSVRVEMRSELPIHQEMLPRLLASDVRMKARQDQSSGSDFHYSPAQFNYTSPTDRVLHDPPYAIHNGIMSSEGPLVDNLNKKTIAMDSVTKEGKLYDVHNIDGTMLGMRTHNALQELRPKERPFVVSRSTYPGAGKYVSHWLGDNYSKWQYLAKSIEGLLQFQLFGIPTIGADLCGFNGNTNEELCNRWMMQGAFSPFMRSHNTEGSISQEPYTWPSVANATRIALHKRYELLPELYSMRARASQKGTPMVKSLWMDFPASFSRLRTRDTQYMLGHSLLVSPVIEPNVDHVKAYFPNAGGSWRNIFTYEALDVQPDTNTSIPAPLSTINVHQRPASIILAHTEAGYTTAETSDKPYALWVNLDSQGKAKGSFYTDDGISPLPTPSRELSFSARGGRLSGESTGEYTVPKPLERVLLMGIHKKPSQLTTADGRDLLPTAVFDAHRSMLNISSLDTDLNGRWSISWS